MKRYKPNAERKAAAINIAQSALSDDTAVQAIDLFPEWSGGGISYAKDDRVGFGGLLYKCVQAHTSQQTWTPTGAVSLWTRIDDPAEQWPQWVQPGSTNPYPMGAKVTHNGMRWVSNHPANVWVLGAVGTENLWIKQEV